MLTTIIKGILVGIVASIPVGPIAIYVMQKSMSNGWKAGMQCALGCTVLDSMLAFFSVFAYGIISGFIESNSGIIEVLGGMIIVGVGIAMVLSTPQKPTDRPMKRSRKKIALDMSKSFLMGLSNPGAFAWMLALYGAFQLDAHDGSPLGKLIIVLSVFIGSFGYWLGFSWLASKGNKLFKISTLTKINHISGVFVCLFGAYLIGIGAIAVL